MKTLLLASILFVGCAVPTDPNEVYYSHRFENQLPPPYAYDVVPDMVTPGGIQVDSSGVPFDVAALDRQIDEVEQCLTETFPGGRLPNDPNYDSSSFPLPLRRDLITIKIDPNHVVSCDGTMQMLAAPAPQAYCQLKGLNGPCQCHWRAGIQANRYIVVTPNLYLLKDPVIRMVTGAANAWTPALAPCSKPTVPSTP